jgi:hypothetical protein
MLGAWKGAPYTKKLCQGCDLGKVEDEEHLLLVCPNTQKVRERFCSALPFAHISTFVDYEHDRPGQVCGMLPVPEDNLSSMIYLLSNGLFGPKWMLNCKQ